MPRVEIGAGALSVGLTILSSRVGFTRRFFHFFNRFQWMA